MKDLTRGDAEAEILESNSEIHDEASHVRRVG